MLIGSQHAPDRPARLVDPVRAPPFQIVLLDELEKAHRTIRDLLLQVLDAGRLSTPRDETVSLRSTVIVATTNLGATEGTLPAIGFGRNPDAGYDPDKVVRELESQFRPEFLNRFQHIVVFQPLTREQAALIARKEIRAILTREGITQRNLIGDVGED